MGEFESGLGQGDLSLPNDESQHLFVAQVSVGLRAKLKQLPYNDPQGPGRKRRCRDGEIITGDTPDADVTRSTTKRQLSCQQRPGSSHWTFISPRRSASVSAPLLFCNHIYS